MIEEVDTWVGTLLDELDQSGVANDTMVVFTADHGEMLGYRSMIGKNNLYDDAVRVPLLMKFPGHIAAGTVVDRPVGHLDMFATMMDFLGHSSSDNSDGKSLRPVIAKVNYNPTYDDGITVSEFGASKMIRHGSWKLMIAREPTSVYPDQLYDLVSDPFEVSNVLDQGASLSPTMVGKAEHLKCLLLEWMARNDGGQHQYYSQADIPGISARRTWKTLPQWQSDVQIQLDAPVFVDGLWRTSAWLFIGRTQPGVLIVNSISLTGVGSDLFTLSRSRGRIRGTGYMSIQISLASAAVIDPSTLAVQVVIQSNVYDRRVVNIVPW
jgi:hypothetical protein